MERCLRRYLSMEKTATIYAYIYKYMWKFKLQTCSGDGVHVCDSAAKIHSPPRMAMSMTGSSASL